jgi:hypothetical protein
MKGLKAIILLVIYAAFTGSLLFNDHVCTDKCAYGFDIHASFENSDSRPAECAEKEALNNPVKEHRAESSIQLIEKFSSPSSDNSYNGIHYSNKVIHNENPPAIPIYIMHCVYRL